MIRVIHSEIVRLRRPLILAAWFGLTALFAAMVSTILFGTVAQGVELPPGAPGVRFPSAAELAESDGIVAGLAAASSMFGIVTLSMWGIATASDRSTGLIRILASAEPRRLRLLAGKVIALALVTAAATALATVVVVMASLPAAPQAGIEVDAWLTEPVPVIATAFGQALAAQLVWGVLGLAVAVVTGSAAAAIAVGVGYVLVFESIVAMIPDVPTDWLLGTTLNALASGGTASVAIGSAVTLGAAYGIIGLIIAGLVFARRDITD